MASLVPTMPVELLTYEGKYRPVVSHNVEIVKASDLSVLATVSTDADGNLPQTSVAPAAGTIVLLSFWQYQGYAGTVAVVTV